MEGKERSKGWNEICMWFGEGAGGTRGFVPSLGKEQGVSVDLFLVWGREVPRLGGEKLSRSCRGPGRTLCAAMGFLQFRVEDRHRQSHLRDSTRPQSYPLPHGVIL